MKWLVACLITIVGLIGCRGSQTSVNTLAPFGSSRVPPPSTNYFNASGPYYNGAAPAQTATPTTPGSTTVPAASKPAGATGGQVVPNASAGKADGAWLPPGRIAAAGNATKASPASLAGAGVQSVSYQGVTKAATQASSPAASNGSTLRLGGMPINDATNGSAALEPARFVPAGAPIEIAQLPPAAPALAAASSGATVVASAQASDQPVPISASPQTTLNWKSRP